jgi:class 3 adenylate cyclase
LQDCPSAANAGCGGMLDMRWSVRHSCNRHNAGGEAMDLRPHIVVVEDEAMQRQLLADYLAGQNFRVSALDGGAALHRLVEREAPALVLLDVGLPGEDGFALARWLREKSSRIGIIMVTSAAGMVDRVVGLETGADDYITKPFEPRELLARVKSVLRRGGPERDAASARRIAAILAADVAGYSRLVGDDEEDTLARLRALRRGLIDPAIDAHHGRIVRISGDGILVEFGSTLDAVRCAVAVQRSVAADAAGPPGRCIQLRVGINVGDVLADGDDILGDSVNVAARLEGIAEPGGICLSAAAYEQVRGKLDIAVADIGEQNLKNIARPVRAYRVLL